MTERVAIVAPTGRDAVVMARILASADISCSAMAAEALVRGIASCEIGVALLTEESLPGLRAADVSGTLERQPLWSDLPFLVLTGKGMLPAGTVAMIRMLGHVTQLERPVHAVTLVNAVRAMMRARARQRDAERYLADRARAESGLRDFAATLEQRVQERTRELGAANDRLFAEMLARIDANDRINQMQAELIHVSRVSAMGTMASAIAHELNQPLTAVMNYVRGGRRMLARDGHAVAEVTAALDAAVESAHHAGEIIRRLRDLVRAGEVKRAAVDVRSLIEDSLAIGMIDAGTRRITHSILLDPAAATVIADPIQIQQVLINLIRNAVDAMPDGGELTIASRPCGDCMVELSVADRGAGIPPQILETLFTPFKTTKGQGMGIGLSISRAIVEANGGRIAGRNRAGGGAVFRFDLPLALTQVAGRTPASDRSADPPA